MYKHINHLYSKRSITNIDIGHICFLPNSESEHDKGSFKVVGTKWSKTETFPHECNQF